MGKRMAIYYSSTALSGAFSGLLAYAVFRIKSEHIKGWQILFIIEGNFPFLVLETVRSKADLLKHRSRRPHCYRRFRGFLHPPKLSSTRQVLDSTAERGCSHSTAEGLFFGGEQQIRSTRVLQTAEGVAVLPPYVLRHI
jgi:hypothetical protein